MLLNTSLLMMASGFQIFSIYLIKLRVISKIKGSGAPHHTPYGLAPVLFQQANLALHRILSTLILSAVNLVLNAGYTDARLS